MSSRSNPDQNLRKRPGHNKHGRNPERLNRSAHSHSNGRCRNNRNLDRENLNEGRKKNRTEDRTTKSLSLEEGRRLKKEREEDEENHYVDHGFRGDARIACRMLLGI